MNKTLIKFIIGLFFFSSSLSAQDFNIFKSEKGNSPYGMDLIQSDEFYDFSRKNIPDLSFYFGNTKGKKKKSIHNTFNEFLVPGDLILNNERYYVYQGCRHQSCSEKAFLWVDKKKEIFMGIIVHYFFDDEESLDGYFLIFSNKIKNPKDFPKKFIEEMKKWNLEETVYNFDSGDFAPIEPIKIRFINLNDNKILDITNLKILN